MSDVKTITKHRRCQRCGYDLFGLLADGRCPECARGIGGVRKPRKPKNPNRVAGQLRRMIRESNRNVWFVTLLWLLPLIGLAACWWFEANALIWVVAFSVFISGLIGHLNERAQRRLWQRRLLEIERKRDGDQGAVEK